MTARTFASLLCGLSFAALSQQVSADMVDLSSAKIVRAKKENPQQKIAADELVEQGALIKVDKNPGDES